MLISRVLAAGVVFPLYIYPGDNCAAWTAVSNAIINHPTMPFYIIINPDSGPGGSANSQPDTNYQSCVSTLRPAANPNVHVIGYVATGFGTRAASAVEADVLTYAGWGAAWRPSGIFFDEVQDGSGNLALYTSYVAYARSHIPGAFISLNPGTAISAGYYTIADQIMSFEDTYASFSTSDLVISSSTPASEQAVILHTAPATLPTDTINTLIHTEGIGALFITPVSEADNPYGSIPSYWDAFVAAVGS
ncbi:Spherulation-specific family 4 [Mycena amicta]|nr:Spherulation-specific family 4 [Mycena amicta]